MLQFSKFDRLVSKKPPVYLYHYTDQSGLLGILSSWEIWATKIQYLNDMSEFSLALSLARESLEESIKIRRYSKHKWLIDIFLQSVGSIERINIFVCSFSEDQDSLSQWRAYGGKNSGFAIGFHSNDLAKVALSNKFILGKCIYGESVQKALVSDLVFQFLEYGTKVFPSSLVDFEHDPKVDETAYRFESQLLRTAPLLKNAHFAEEREWRLISEVLYSSNPKVSFRPGTSMITPYFRLSLPKNKASKRVHEIVVGPTPHMRYSIASVRTCTTSRGVECKKVSRSDIPFRNW